MPSSPGSLSPTPTAVHSPYGSLETRIEWSDGKTTLHPHRILKGLCPCAHCQGHEGGVRWVEAVEEASSLALQIRELEQVGNYALGLTWADGHSGGIYTFEYLRTLARLNTWPADKLKTFRWPEPR